MDRAWQAGDLPDVTCRPCAAVAAWPAAALVRSYDPLMMVIRSSRTSLEGAPGAETVQSLYRADIEESRCLAGDRLLQREREPSPCHDARQPGSLRRCRATCRAAPYITCREPS